MSDRRLLLVVEDSPEDYGTILRALRRAQVEATTERCGDGDLALDRLLGAAGEGLPRPALVLLDLNLPGTDGREVLRAIRATPRLADLPDAVLTTSADPRDVESCRRLGASSYLRKSADAAGFERVTGWLRELWLAAAPPAPEAP